MGNKYPKYVYRKRGVYYFVRRVPKRYWNTYSVEKIAVSLGTRSIRIASSKATAMSAYLERDWSRLDLAHEANVLARYRADGSGARDFSKNMTLTEARELYFSHSAEQRSKNFFNSVNVAVERMLKTAGDKSIDLYTRSEVNAYRDALVAEGLAQSSVRRNVNTLRALVWYGCSEAGIEKNPAFASVKLPAGTKAPVKRRAIPLEHIITLQKECFTLGDDRRLLIALLSDTGMRLSEALGLTLGDIFLDAPIPYLRVQNAPWRRLKTNSSARCIPLAGAALRAAERLCDGRADGFVFPRYCDGILVKPNVASATLNKWLKPHVPEGCVLHSFRHSFRDRLRSVQCPIEIIDALGGWSRAGVGDRYGEGYPLSVLANWCNKIVN